MSDEEEYYDADAAPPAAPLASYQDENAQEIQDGWDKTNTVALDTIVFDVEIPTSGEYNRAMLVAIGMPRLHGVRAAFVTHLATLIQQPADNIAHERILAAFVTHLASTASVIESKFASCGWLSDYDQVLREPNATTDLSVVAAMHLKHVDLSYSVSLAVRYWRESTIGSVESTSFAGFEFSKSNVAVRIPHDVIGPEDSWVLSITMRLHPQTNSELNYIAHGGDSTNGFVIYPRGGYIYLDETVNGVTVQRFASTSQYVAYSLSSEMRRWTFERVGSVYTVKIDGVETPPRSAWRAEDADALALSNATPAPTLSEVIVGGDNNGGAAVFVHSVEINGLRARFCDVVPPALPPLNSNLHCTSWVPRNSAGESNPIYPVSEETVPRGGIVLIADEERVRYGVRGPRFLRVEGATGYTGLPGFDASFTVELRVRCDASTSTRRNIFSIGYWNRPSLVWGVQYGQLKLLEVDPSDDGWRNVWRSVVPYTAGVDEWTTISISRERITASHHRWVTVVDGVAAPPDDHYDTDDVTDFDVGQLCVGGRSNGEYSYTSFDGAIDFFRVCGEANCTLESRPDVAPLYWFAFAHAGGSVPPGYEFENFGTVDAVCKWCSGVANTDGAADRDWPVPDAPGVSAECAVGEEVAHTIVSAGRYKGCIKNACT